MNRKKSNPHLRRRPFWPFWWGARHPRPSNRPSLNQQLKLFLRYFSSILGLGFAGYYIYKYHQLLVAMLGFNPPRKMADPSSSPILQVFPSRSHHWTRGQNDSLEPPSKCLSHTGPKIFLYGVLGPRSPRVSDGGKNISLLCSPGQFSNGGGEEKNHQFSLVTPHNPSAWTSPVDQV